LNQAALRTIINTEKKHEEVSGRASGGKAEVSDAEFRRRLKNISEWRKKRLAKLHPKDSR
jgi:hypothetical protein